jgi:hypothetical protein
MTRATFMMLIFTMQKNAVHGEFIGLGLSRGNPFICPLQMTAIRLRPPDRPSYIYYTNNKAYYVTPDDISIILKSSVHYIGPSLGFSHKDVSTHSLRTASAMTHLSLHVNYDTTQLQVCWRLDEMQEH